MKTNIPSRLSDDELTAELKRLAGCERGVTVDLIIHLAEFDRRRLYLPAGFSSLFAYCIEVLRLSEHGPTTGSSPHGRLAAFRSFSGCSSRVP